MIQALPDGILNNLVTMINFMKEGEFVKANDIYLLTAIGNAPWPIGLTMVGIHERSGMHVYSIRSISRGWPKPRQGGERRLEQIFKRI